MSESKQDRRVRRTQQRLSAALIELLVEKEYDRITVQDIIERADVGRSTFYAHYLDKDDLLAGNLSAFRIDISQHFDMGPEGGVLLRTTQIFEHAQQHYALYRAMVGTNGIALVQRMASQNMRENLEAYITHLAENEHPIPLPAPVIAHYLTGAFFGLLAWWLDSKLPHTPHEMDEMFQKLAMSGLERLVSEQSQRGRVMNTQSD